MLSIPQMNFITWPVTSLMVRSSIMNDSSLWSFIRFKGDVSVIVFYVWKIIEGLVPNFFKPIVCSYSEHRGRSCIISHVKMGRLGSLAYNNFRWRAIRIFNAIPKYIRCISSCSVVSFKSKLGCYLKNIINLQGRPGFSNSHFTMVDTEWGPGFQLDYSHL